MYKITLTDGTVIDNLELNGNNFISSDTHLTTDAFTDNLENIKIECDEVGVEDETVVHGVLAKFEPNRDKIWFVIREKTANELAAENIQKALAADYDNIVDLQLALAEVYELVISQ